MGRRGRRAGKTRRLSARYSQTVERIQLPRRVLRPFWARLHPHARQFDLQSENGIRNYGEFIDRAADLVVSYGGSLSGEHGDGQSRGALLPKMFGPELMRAFGEFKAAWDPGQ